jgi:hypothetical protein
MTTSEHREREKHARQILITRAGLTHDELVTTMRTLVRKLGAVDLSDMIRPPGFDSLGNANSETPEWKLWATVTDLRGAADGLGHQLLEAENDLVLANHWGGVQ